MRTHSFLRYWYSVLFLCMVSIRLLAQNQTDSLSIPRFDSVEALPNGDTLYIYEKDFFDFGGVYDNSTTSKLYSIKTLSDTLPVVNDLSAIIDRNKYVGSIPYEEGQTPAGGKTYAIPFATVPVNGISPQIALKYNSQSGNGLAGMGWDLDGISMIVLTNRNLYYDNEVVAGVVGKGDQVYTLDGMRLVPSTKVSGFTLETAQGQIVVQPQYNGTIATSFTARYPDGSVATFGGQSYYIKNCCFPIANITDTRGYRLDFEYIESGSRSLISKIKYGGRTTGAHPAFLEFQYESRNDVPTVYIGGEAVTLDKKLKKIISYNDSKELRTYTLTYQLQGVNLLAQVDCSVGSASLNPLKFEYGSNDVTISGYDLIRDGSCFLTEYFDTSKGVDFIFGRGRFQNARYEDGLVTYPGFSIYAELAHTSSGHYQFGSKFSPDQNLLIAPSITFLSTVQKIRAEEGFQLLVATDIDGDGMEELVKVNSTVVSGKNQLRITTYKYSNGNFISSAANINLEGVINDRGLLSPISRSYFFGDFNGGRYILGLPQLETITQTRGGSTWMTTKELSYTDNGLPVSQISKTQGLQANKTVWTYNNGNLASKKSAPRTITELLGDTCIYDPAMRYILSKTDALGRVTGYSSYDQFGQPQSVTDYLGKKTTYICDSWGRLNTVNYPDGTLETNTYAWDATTGVYMTTQAVTGSPTQRVYYNALGCEIRNGVQRFDGSWQYIDKQYDSYGRLWKESMPFKGTFALLWNVYAYDSYDRLLSLTEASGKVTSYSYSDNTETTTKDGITSSRTYDKSGLLISVTDPAGTITYVYRPDRQFKNTIAPGGATTTFDYDPSYGYRTKIVDPSAGTMTFSESYSRNILTISQKNANEKTVSTVFDKYGRPTNKIQPEFTTTYLYDAKTKKLSSESSTNGTSCTYTYDDFGRISTQKEVAGDNVWMQRTYGYSGGNVSNIAYNSSKEGTIGTEYMTYTNGCMSEIKLGTTSIWKLTAENSLGQPISVTTGPLSRTYAYSAYGMPTERKAGSIHHFAYTFDVLKNNLTSRTDKLRNITESFGYDNLNRLTSYGGKTTGYDVKGNITSMSGIGTMNYTNANKPYAVTGVTLSSSQIPTRTQNVTYTSFQRPFTISENGSVATFTYNDSGDRAKMTLTQNGTAQNTTYYIGDCYETNNTETRLHLAGGYYSSPIVYVKKSGSWGIYYICRDYLGSITHVTNSSGTLQQELSYDAWGRLRNPATQVLLAPGSEPTPFIGRGYTGHEHLAFFGLVNMNARLYDLALGRFLSPDPYVQMIDFTQSFNRYSYALNNPLIYVDPTGEWFLIDDIIGAVIGGVINVVINAAQGNIHSVGHGFALFGAGAASGVTTLYAGPIAGAAILGATNNALNQGFNNGWGNISWMQVGSSAIMGGTTAYLGGALGSYLAKPIGSLTSGIASPVLREVLAQGTMNSVTGFALGTSFAFASGESFGDALNQGVDGAALGFITGTISGATKDIRTNRNTKSQERTIERQSAQESTARTVSNSLEEQLVLQEAKANPGIEIMRGRTNDSNWEGWAKMQYTHKLSSGKIVNIHYWQHNNTRVKMLFKFKNIP